MIKKLLMLFLVISSSSFAQSDVIVTDSTSKSTVDSRSTTINETTVKSPPPSAISPSMNILNNDICTTGVSGSVQTQILGFSGGSTIRDLNCERLKLAKNLFDMGMKVAAVATLCQDRRVFDAMMNAGTPCPVDGKIGADAKQVWDANPDRAPTQERKDEDSSLWQKITFGLGIFGLLLFLL
jgi:hypothetical protein